jgi:hypothetical protein
MFAKAIPARLSRTVYSSEGAAEPVTSGHSRLHKDLLSIVIRVGFPLADKRLQRLKANRCVTVGQEPFRRFDFKRPPLA